MLRGFAAPSIVDIPHRLRVMEAHVNRPLKSGKDLRRQNRVSIGPAETGLRLELMQTLAEHGIMNFNDAAAASPIQDNPAQCHSQDARITRQA
jgi:hypothetical protein